MRPAIDPEAIVPTARGEMYGLLALGFAEPGSDLVVELVAAVNAVRARVAAIEAPSLCDVVGSLDRQVGASTNEALERGFLECFGHGISKDCPPYEIEYGQSHVFQQTQTLADVAGFYQAFGLERAPGFRDRLDHIVAELEFMQFLCAKEAYAIAAGHSGDRVETCTSAQRAFLGEHLAAWAPEFAGRLRAMATCAFYQELARLLAVFLAVEVERGGIEVVSSRAGSSWEPPEDQAVLCEGCPALSP